MWKHWTQTLHFTVGILIHFMVHIVLFMPGHCHLRMMSQTHVIGIVMVCCFYQICLSTVDVSVTAFTSVVCLCSKLSGHETSQTVLGFVEHI